MRSLLLSLAVGAAAHEAVAQQAEPARDPATRGAEETTVFDFGAGAEPWPSINDTVMGGVSQSSMRIEDGVAVFAGDLSLENNGGFASLRSQPAEHDLVGFGGIVLRILGDGKTYGVRLRTNARFDGVSYQARVETEAGRWIEARIPFESFQPVFRGREVKDYPALEPADVRTFGLIISDKQVGPFRLEIDWIKAFGRPASGTRLGFTVSES